MGGGAPPGHEPMGAGAVAGDPGRVGGRGRLRRALAWGVGLAVTGVCLWLALRGVPLGEVSRVIARTDWPLLLAVAVPAQVLCVHVRALRWRHLTDVIQPIPRFPLFRATSIGFMANNLLPGRAGEFVRAWVLARETGASGAGILGTVVLERVIDSITFLGLAAAVLWVGGTRALGGGALVGAAISLLVALVLPVVVLVWLRLAPEQALGFMHRVVTTFLPRRLSEQVAGLLERFARGLGSLRGGAHLFWVSFHSVLLWGVLSVIPFWAGAVALGVEFGSPGRLVAAGYATLAAVGLAVALPAAPGFFGTYHLACKEALGVFGVPDSQAFALAVVVHGTFWVTMTALGLALLPFGQAGLRGGLEAAASDQDPPSERR